MNSSRYTKRLGSCILHLSPEDEIEIKGALAAIEKERKAGFDAMLRQISASVVISKIREDA